jgi:YD repeat-containing protein
VYDDQDRPVEAVFHDAKHTLLRTITFTRDTDGRVVTEDARMAQAGPAHFEAGLGELSPDDRAQLVAVVSAAFGSIVTTFTYDSAGHVTERRRQMGTLSDECTTFVYDDHGNSVHERTERRDREMRLDANGGMQTIEDIVRTHESRFEYTCDRVGNWTERIVSARVDPHAEFQRSNVERRTIEYLRKVNCRSRTAMCRRLHRS